MSEFVPFPLIICLVSAHLLEMDDACLGFILATIVQH